MRPKHLLAAAAVGLATTAIAQSTDPYLWLEDIQGAKPLAQVKEWNAQTEDLLTKMPGYEAHRQRALALLNDPNRIAMPDQVMGDLVANHWVDENHKRGLWRVSPLNAYLAGKPEWRTVIDVDALGKAERKSWVWHGANCMATISSTAPSVSLSGLRLEALISRLRILATSRATIGRPLGQSPVASRKI